MKQIMWNQNWTVAAGVTDPFAVIFGGGAEGKPVTLPQDAMILEKRSADCGSGTQSGFYPAKSYTYQKEFFTVRIPVPFFLFEDVGPYIHCHEYLDKAFIWARKYGLKVLVDLHTAPGGHNGTDNSGICGVCLWSTRSEYMEYTLIVLERIAQRYGKEEAMWGISVLNEPMCSDTEAAQALNIHNLTQVYPPADQALAAENTNCSLDYLRQFYRDAYRVIRKHMGSEKYVVFSDAFELEIWDAFLNCGDFEGVVLDTHNYLMTPDQMLFTERNLQVYVRYLRSLGEKVNAAAKRFPLIVGEWNIQNRADGLEQMGKEEKDRLYTAIADEFLEGMKDTLGWFYWSYKIYLEGIDAECDDAGRCVNHGWLRPGERRVP